MCLAVLGQHREGQRTLHGQGISGFEITISGRAVRLTMREAAVLRALLRQRDAVVRRGELEAGIWGRIKSRTPDVHIARLRNKLGPLGQRIETVPRVGYRYRDSSSISTSISLGRRSGLRGT
jgi:DNA-binding response OmpR family regulator